MKLKLAFILISLFIVFQNCSQVKIEKIEEPTTIVSLSKPINSLCAPIGASFSTPVRFVFIMDMSMSNIGTLVTNTQNNKTTYYVDKTDGPSDLNGDRFLHVKKFITECGGNNNTSYSIMGFSKDSIMVNDNSCLSPFENYSKALVTIDAMKGLQDHDLTINVQQDNNPFYLQGETYYNTGLQCLKSKIMEDVNLLKTEKPIYHVFFITDGLTTDKAENQNYKQVLSELQTLTSTSAGGFNFYPVYYTSPGAKNQNQQQTTALSLLDSMAKAVNPQQKTLLLNNISTKNNQFCQLIQSGIKVQYELKKIYAVNLTSITKENKQFSDSDMDGLSDSDEKNLGWNPLDPQSTSINDALCNKLGNNKALCESERRKIICDPLIKSLTLTDCDLKISFKVYGGNISFSDSDKDFIPDFLEVTKGSNPLRFDSIETPFADGLNNLLKVELGLDLKTNNNILPLSEDKKMKIQFYETNVSSCKENSRGYEYILDNVPLQPVEAFNNYLSDNNNLYHNKDENVIMLISYWQSSGGIALPDKIYTQTIKIGVDNPTTKIGDLNFLGELK